MSLLFALAALGTVEGWAWPVEGDACREPLFSYAGPADADGRIHPERPPQEDVSAIFPLGAFSPFVCTWYSNHLTVLQERALPRTPGAIVARFTWLRTFHAPMSFRVTMSTDSSMGTLQIKTASGLGGYHPGVLQSSTEQAFTAEQSMMFLTRLGDADVCAAQHSENTGTDGAAWIFEYADTDFYCLVVAHSPAHGELMELGEWLIDFASVPADERY